MEQEINLCFINIDKVNMVHLERKDRKKAREN